MFGSEPPSFESLGEICSLCGLITIFCLTVSLLEFSSSKIYVRSLFWLFISRFYRVHNCCSFWDLSFFDISLSIHYYFALKLKLRYNFLTSVDSWCSLSKVHGIAFLICLAVLWLISLFLKVPTTVGETISLYWL